MTEDVAHAAIDYFLDNSSQEEQPSITFYGGEPLLNMRLLSSCVDYSRTKLKGRNPRFQLTTNGLALTPKVSRELVDMDMNMLVSVDGPREAHDSNRLTKSGIGTFDKVMENLRSLRELHTDYYCSHIGITSVLSPYTDIILAHEFFTADELFSTGILQVSFVNGLHSDYWSKNQPSEEWWDSIEILRAEYYECLVRGNGPADKFLTALFQKDLLRLYRRDTYRRFPQRLPLNGCCEPGARRLYVDVSGRYHLCERINQTMPIGSVENGIDSSLADAVWSDYVKTHQDKCCDCWGSRFCTRCFARAGEGGMDVPEKQCHGHLKSLERQLVDYCEIAELNPLAFSFMDTIVIA